MPEAREFCGCLRRPARQWQFTSRSSNRSTSWSELMPALRTGLPGRDRLIARRGRTSAFCAAPWLDRRAVAEARLERTAPHPGRTGARRRRFRESALYGPDYDRRFREPAGAAAREPRARSSPASRSGSGKTTVTLGLMRALRRRGLARAGRQMRPGLYRSGLPRRGAGRASYNLDSWAMPPALLDALVAGRQRAPTSSSPKLDGPVRRRAWRGGAARGASADIAARYGWPVLLVLDVSGQAQSAAAIAPAAPATIRAMRIAGVVLNRSASDRHRRLVARGVEAVGLPVLGALPRDATLVLPERHLGLVQAERDGGSRRAPRRARRLRRGHVDLDAHPSLAAGAGTATRRRRRRSAAGPAHRARARRGLLLHLSASARRLARGGGGDPALLAAGRRGAGPAAATPSGCRAAIPSCMPAACRRAPLPRWPARALRRPGPSMASAAATWCSGRTRRNCSK